MTTVIIHILHVLLQIASGLVRGIASNLSGLAIIGICIVGWKLTKGDSFLSRVTRILITLTLLAQAAKAARTGNELHPLDEGNGLVNKELYAMEGIKAMACSLPLTFLWVSKITEAIGNLIWSSFDSEDTSPLKDETIRKESDRLALLIRKGRNAAAIRMAKRMKKSGNHSALAMDTVIVRLSH